MMFNARDDVYWDLHFQCGADDLAKGLSKAPGPAVRETAAVG
jgi:hypothetical protein